MKIKKGVTAIIFDRKGGLPYFLLLHRCLNWRGWEFVKGGVEKNEPLEEAALREAREETGLQSLELQSKLAGPLKWKATGTTYLYTVFLVKGNMGEEVMLTQAIQEHDGFQWVPAEKVPGLLTHEDNKKIFQKAMQWLKNA